MANITIPVTLYIGADGEHELFSFFSYDTETPFDVGIYVPNDDHITFSIPRDIVAAGLNRSCSPEDCACKDVCLQTAGADWLQAVLQRPRTEPLHAWIPRKNLAEFLARAFTLVPRGQEILDYDWDEDLRRLLGPGPDD